MKTYINSLVLTILMLGLCACLPAQQRGLAGSQYVSTSRPSFAMGVIETLPLQAGGRGTAKLNNAGVLGGLLADAWLATYGNAEQGPFAVIAHAEAPRGWYWDSVSPHSFSIDAGHELIGNLGFEAWTYVMGDRRNPFFLPTDAADTDERWIVRCFAQRADFDRGKIVLEYRERLPKEIASITALPLGYGNFTKEFAQRAREAFVQGDTLTSQAGITQGAMQKVRWQYLDESFLGTVSRYTDRNVR